MIEMRDRATLRLYRCCDEARNIPIYLLAVNVLDAYVRANRWAEENNCSDWQFNEITVVPGTFVEETKK